VSAADELASVQQPSEANLEGEASTSSQQDNSEDQAQTDAQTDTSGRADLGDQPQGSSSQQGEEESWQEANEQRKVRAVDADYSVTSSKGGRNKAQVKPGKKAPGEEGALQQPGNGNMARTTSTSSEAESAEKAAVLPPKPKPGAPKARKAAQPRSPDDAEDLPQVQGPPPQQPPPSAPVPKQQTQPQRPAPPQTPSQTPQQQAQPPKQQPPLQRQPSTAPPAVPSTATAGPTASTSAPAAASHASTAVAAPTTAAATSGTTSGRPSWVKARPDQRSNRGIVASDSAARPRDITNLPLIVGASPSKGQAKQLPNTVSPGKQTTMQSFFQPKQVLNPQQRLQQHSQQQQQQQQQQQVSTFGNLQTSAGASGNMFYTQGTMQNAAQQQGMPIRQAGPQQGSQSWQQPPQHQQQWQQQQQQQMLAQAAPKPAVKVSGVFADDDDFDDIWMSDQAFQAPATKPAHNRALPGAGHSIQAMPVIDLAGSPAHKKARTLGG